MQPTNNDDIDHDHDEINKSLMKLGVSRKLNDLIQLRDLTKDHFEHEEEIFEEDGHSRTDSFSAVKGHIEQHKRLIDNMNEEIAIMKESGSGGNMVVDAKFIEAVINEFLGHVVDYDAKYVEFRKKSQAAV